MIPKRGAIAGFLTAVGLALLLTFKTPEVVPPLSNPTDGTGSGGQGAGATSTTGTTAGSGNGTGTGTGTTTGTGTGKGSYSGTLTGQAIQIPFGTVQVKVVYQNGKITDVQAVQLPSGDRHTNQISQYAGPQLRTQALQAQSASINGVSGATYTSYGYQQSLQSALDQLPA